MIAVQTQELHAKLDPSLLTDGATRLSQYNRSMEKVVRVFKSHEEADRADREYYLSLTPAQRLSIVFTLVKQSGPAADRFERVCRVVNRKED